MDHLTRTERVLIAGGSGFVGSAVRAALADRPVRLLQRKPANTGSPDDRVEWVAGDVTDPNSLRGTMDGCNAVVHLVAIIKESGNETFDRVIREGTENV